jgi:hypothetical protein
MTNLPRLELTEEPNKNNDFIIFRNPSKGNKIKKSKSVTKKRAYKKKHGTKKRKHRQSRKGFLNIF